MTLSTDEGNLAAMVSIHKEGTYIPMHCSAWRKAANWTDITYKSVCCPKCHYKDHIKMTLRRLPKDNIYMGKVISSYLTYVVCCRVSTLCLKDKS